MTYNDRRHDKPPTSVKFFCLRCSAMAGNQVLSDGEGKDEVVCWWLYDGEVEDEG